MRRTVFVVPLLGRHVSSFCLYRTRGAPLYSWRGLWERSSGCGQGFLSKHSYLPRVALFSSCQQFKPTSKNSIVEGTNRCNHQQIGSSEDTSFSTTTPSNGSPVFGYNPGGKTITNMDTILQDIDRALGVTKPPDVEIILTEHICNTANALSKWTHLHFLRFGHVAIRYRTSDGRDRIMNINGDFSTQSDDVRMVNFISPPQEFYFGTDAMRAQQGGVYNRPFVSVRIENVAPGATDALHAYYEAIDKASRIQVTTKRNRSEGNGTDHRSNHGAVRFNLVDINLSSLARQLPPPFEGILYKITDFFQQRHEQYQQQNQVQTKDSVSGDEVKSSRTRVSGSLQDIRSFTGRATSSARQEIGNLVQDVEEVFHDVRGATFVAGNCAQWTSKGLAFCGLLRRPRIFPKAILVELLEDEVFAGRKNNAHVVVYRQVEHARRKSDWGGPYNYLRSAYVHPLRIVRNLFYGNPEDFAHVIVEVPKNTTVATIARVQTSPAKQPIPALRVVSIANAVIPAAILVGLVDHIGPMGPVGAAAWLVLNWWLH